MILISHRGNLNGKNEKFENHPNYIQDAKKKGFDVEIDVWFKDNNFYLGHDKPNEKIEQDFLLDHKEKLWIHCKNLQGLEVFNTYDVLNFFWHENDKYTLTSKNFIWTYPEEKTGENSIIVSLDSNVPEGRYIGICSDNIEKIKNKIEN